MNGTLQLAAIPETGLYSHDRADHPNATYADGSPRCFIVRPHRQHAYGKRMATGLAHWCDGVPEPDDDPTGGR